MRITTETTTHIRFSTNKGKTLLTDDMSGNLVRREVPHKIALIRMINECLHEFDGLQAAKEIADMLIATHDYWWWPPEVTG